MMVLHLLVHEIVRREVLSEWEKEYQKDINCLYDTWKEKNRIKQKSF